MAGYVGVSVGAVGAVDAVEHGAERRGVDSGRPRAMSRALGVVVVCGAVRHVRVRGGGRGRSCGRSGVARGFVGSRAPRFT